MGKPVMHNGSVLWKATVTNTKTGYQTYSMGTAKPEVIAHEALRIAEWNTSLENLPDRWEIVVEIVKEP